MEAERLRIAMLSVHSCPVGELGTKDTGGMSVCIRELARELGKRGHWIDIYTSAHGPGCEPRLDLYENVRLVHLETGHNGQLHKLALYPYLADFSRELEGFRMREGLRYDLIHSHYWLSGRVGCWTQERWSVPHLLMFHTLGAVKNAILGPGQEPELRIATEKQLAKECQRVLAASKHEKECLIRYYGIPPDKISVVPCGVNLDLFTPQDRQRGRQELGLDPDASIVMYVGRFAALKGLDRLLEAVSCLKHLPQLRLVIVGGDGDHTPEHQALERLSRDLGVQGSVTFAGRVEHEDLPLYYSAADVLVLPSHYESFGLVALESLACGTPVVSTRVGAIESILRGGETGYVVRDSSPRFLAEGIEAVLAASATGRVPVEAIRASVSSSGWSEVAPVFVNEYVSVCRGRHAACTCNSSGEIRPFSDGSMGLVS